MLIEADREHLRSYAEAEAKRARELAAAEAERKARASVGRWNSFEPENGGGFKVHSYLPPGYVEGEASNRGRPVAFLFHPEEIPDQSWIAPSWRRTSSAGC